MVKRVQNCINIRSNCIIMQFYRDCYWVKSVTLSDGRRKYFQSKIRHWWIEDISNWNRKNLELHFDGCNFTLRKLPLCILMLASLHSKSCFFAWLPPMICLEVKYPTFFFLILNELHSASENFTFLTKINYIPYENTLHSLPEYTSFS